MSGSSPRGYYPRATKFTHSTNGEGIIVAFTSLDESVNPNVKRMKAAMSFNGGVTWTETTDIQTLPLNTDDNDEPNIIQLPNNRRLLYVFRNHSKDPNTGAWTQFRITLHSSDNDGFTWPYLKQVHEWAASNNGLWEPVLRLLPNGDLHCYFSEETSDVDQDVVIHRSIDSGANWAYYRTAVGLNLGYTRDGRPGVTATTNGGKTM